MDIVEEYHSDEEKKEKQVKVKKTDVKGKFIHVYIVLFLCVKYPNRSLLFLGLFSVTTLNKNKMNQFIFR